MVMQGNLINASIFGRLIKNRYFDQKDYSALNRITRSERFLEKVCLLLGFAKDWLSALEIRSFDW